MLLASCHTQKKGWKHPHGPSSSIHKRNVINAFGRLMITITHTKYFYSAIVSPSARECRVSGSPPCLVTFVNIKRITASSTRSMFLPTRLSSSSSSSRERFTVRVVANPFSQIILAPVVGVACVCVCVCGFGKYFDGTN